MASIVQTIRRAFRVPAQVVDASVRLVGWEDAGLASGALVLSVLYWIHHEDWWRHDSKLGFLTKPLRWLGTSSSVLLYPCDWSLTDSDRQTMYENATRQDDPPEGDGLAWNLYDPSTLAKAEERLGVMSDRIASRLEKRAEHVQQILDEKYPVTPAKPESKTAAWGHALVKSSVHAIVDWLVPAPISLAVKGAETIADASGHHGSVMRSLAGLWYGAEFALEDWYTNLVYGGFWPAYLTIADPRTGATLYTMRDHKSKVSIKVEQAQRAAAALVQQAKTTNQSVEAVIDSGPEGQKAAFQVNTARLIVANMTPTAAGPFDGVDVWTSTANGGLGTKIGEVKDDNTGVLRLVVRNPMPFDDPGLPSTAISIGNAHLALSDSMVSTSPNVYNNQQCTFAGPEGSSFVVTWRGSLPEVTAGVVSSTSLYV